MSLRLSNYSSEKCLLIWMFIVTLQWCLARGALWNCAEDVKGFKFDLDRISGTWYEAARLPPSEVPACVSVQAPNVTDNDTYNLQVDYINNVNKQWEPTTENLTFPWNETTQNGIFELKYGSGAATVTFIFKLMITDYDNVAAICYYTTYSPSFSLLKIMTRQQNVNATFQNLVQKLADKYGFGSQLTWVEQSSKCNGSKMITSTYSGVLFLLLIFIQKILNKI